MNDLIPEEQDPQFEEVIALLRRVNLNPLFVDSRVRTQVISQARARLFPTDSEISQPEHNSAREMQEPIAFPGKPKAQREKRRRLVHLLNMLAAVLVIALLVGSALRIFGQRPPLQNAHSGIGPTIGPVGAPVKVSDVTLDGFERVFKITPGPYFLGELLEVDLSITNHTHTNYWLVPELGSSTACELLRVQTFGGGSPHVTDIQHSWKSLPRLLACNWPWSGDLNPSIVVQLSVNQTTTVKQYVQLTSSGHITLSIMDSLRRSTTPNGRSTPDTLNLIDLRPYVSTLVPSDRQLGVKVQGTQLVIPDQPAVRGQLIGEWVFDCPQGELGKVGPGSLSAPVVVTMPDCFSRGSKPLWLAFIVGAPGYALVYGKVNGS